jgi:glycosyltransferase involved in cell wall biosynthesis
MRVAHVIWHLDVGGGEVFLCSLAAALARRNIEQHVFTVGPPGALAPGIQALGAPVTSLRKSTRAGLLTIGRLARRLRRLAPAVVHTHGEAGVFWGLPAARLAGRRAVALVYQNEDEAPVKMMVERGMLRMAAVVVAGSGDIARFVGERFGVTGARLRTIYCGVPVTLPAGDAAPPGAKQAPPTLITVGRLVARKGHAALIEALALVRGRVPGTRLVIVGDGPERPALEALAARRGMGAAVTFAGTVHPAAPLLAAADVFVFPSLTEPQGLALLDAFVAGTPVVASRTGGIPEMLRDDVEGLLVEPGNSPALADAIVRMLHDRGLRESCVVGGRRRAATFDVEAIADEYVDLYSSVAGARPS